MHIAVVGAGVTGLATAALLRRGGAQVTLLEATSRLGGLAAAVEVGPHRFCPGPQYLWGLSPGDDGARVLAACGARMAHVAVAPDFERVVLGDAPLGVHAPLIAGRPPALSAAGAAFVDVLDALGRAGLVIARDAGFCDGLHGMLRRVASSSLSLADKATLWRHKDDSVADVIRRLQVPAIEARVLLAAQPIFAESLASLSVVLFAACRAVGAAGVAVPVGGLPAFVDALVDAVNDAGVSVVTDAPVNAAVALGDRVRVDAAHGSVVVDHVVWACSPAVVGRVLGAAWPARARFTPGHSICCVAVDADLDADVCEHLRLRSWSWFADEHDVDFDAARADAGVRALNLLSPTLNACALPRPEPRQLVCAYAATGSSVDDVTAEVVRLLRPTRVHDVVAFDGAGWEQFGPGGTAVYGRRKTAASMQRAVAVRLPRTMTLAHAGAGIPGVLGCLQMADATARALLRSRRARRTRSTATARAGVTAGVTADVAAEGAC